MNRYSRITGTGSFLPPRRVTNADLAAQLAGHGVETSDDWIVERTGIRARHFAERDVGSSDLALEAAKRAITDAGLEPTDIDCIIFGTLSPDFHFPGTAVVLQKKLGIAEKTNCACFDIRQQCSAFVYGMQMADAFVRTGMYKRILLIGAELHSHALDYSTRGAARRKDVREDVTMQADRRSMLVAAAMAAALSTACEKPVAVVAPPPPEVYVATVVQQDVPVYLDLVGQTQGFQDVEIRARVEGFLDAVNFREGSFVRKGDLLYQIDPQPLQASLAQANAAKATGEADLKTARARLEKANNDVARYTPLVAKQAVSQRELDDARALQDAAGAQVEAAGSQVEAAKAAVDKATLDLGYVRIAAPISGLVGTTVVKAGSLVGRGESTLLTTISVLDPRRFRRALVEPEGRVVVGSDNRGVESDAGAVRQTVLAPQGLGGGAPELEPPVIADDDLVAFAEFGLAPVAVDDLAADLVAAL